MITVCGAGTLGGALVEHLVREAWPAIRVIDDDKIAAPNLRNQVYEKHQIGLPKVRALEELAMRTGRGTVEGVRKRLVPANALRLLEASTLVIDAFDNHDGRAAVQAACRAAGLACLHVGLHPSGYGEVVWDERYVVPPDGGTDACEARRLARRRPPRVVDHHRGRSARRASIVARPSSARQPRAYCPARRG